MFLQVNKVILIKTDDIVVLKLLSSSVTKNILFISYLILRLAKYIAEICFANSHSMV